MNIFKLLKRMRKASSVPCDCSIYLLDDDKVILSWKFMYGQKYSEAVTEQRDDEIMNMILKSSICRAGLAISRKFPSGVVN